jgi:hypothetical protein
VEDMAPVLLKNGYVLEVISPDKFTLTHEKNGMRFSSDELRPNGRDFVEQLREAVGKRQAQERKGQSPNRDGGIEL